MGRVFSIVSLVIVGVIIADILTHPAGVTAASSGINQLAQTSFSALLGGTNPGGV